MASEKMDIKTVGTLIAAVVVAIVGGGGFAISAKSETKADPSKLEVIDKASINKMERMEERQLMIMQRVTSLETRQEVLIQRVKDLQNDIKHINGKPVFATNIARRSEDD